jgi:hypothetical protein
MAGPVFCYVSHRLYRIENQTLHLLFCWTRFRIRKYYSTPITHVIGKPTPSGPPELVLVILDRVSRNTVIYFPRPSPFGGRESRTLF